MAWLVTHAYSTKTRRLTSLIANPGVLFQVEFLSATVNLCWCLGIPPCCVLLTGPPGSILVVQKLAKLAGMLAIDMALQGEEFHKVCSRSSDAQTPRLVRNFLELDGMMA